MPGHPKALSTRSDAYSTTICRISNRETSPLRAPALCSCVTSDPNPSVSEMPYRWEDLRIRVKGLSEVRTAQIPPDTTTGPADFR